MEIFSENHVYIKDGMVDVCDGPEITVDGHQVPYAGGPYHFIGRDGASAIVDVDAMNNVVRRLDMDDDSIQGVLFNTLALEISMLLYENAYNGFFGDD